MRVDSVTYSKKTLEYCLTLMSGEHIFVDDKALRKARHGQTSSGSSVLVCLEVSPLGEVNLEYLEAYIHRVDPDVVYGDEIHRSSSKGSIFIPRSRVDILKHVLESHLAIHSAGIVRSIQYPRDDDGQGV